MTQPITTLSVIDFSEIKDLPGKEYIGEWFQSDLEHREQFLKGSYSYLESPFAPSGPLPKDTVHGFQLLSFMELLMDRMLRVKVEQRAGYNYGFDKVRFTSVVTVRDRIRLRFKITNVREKDGGYVLELDTRIEVEGREKPAMIAQWLLFWILP